LPPADAASTVLPAPFVHPLAVCDSERVGAGTAIWPFSHVSGGAVVGERCKIGEHCYLEDGCTLGDRVTVKNGALIWRGVHIGDDVFVGPRATFTNDAQPRVEVPVPADELLTTHVGNGVTLGASVTVLPGVAIGDYAFIGAASLVTRDVPSHALMFGVPARQRGWVCRCGERLVDGGGDLACSCGRRYRLSDDRLREVDLGVA
jgi:UDP-2-acetamido-3-amino-2,3-dideoxy-glucuronate N-acetyltransferase